MAPESIADEARTPSDEAIRRIREESRRRIERQNGWRAFSSLCALASLVGGISLATMNAREARLQQRALLEAEAEAAFDEAQARERAARAAADREQKARVAEACAKRDAGLSAIDAIMHHAVATARTTQAREYARAHAALRRSGVVDAAAAWGCDQPVPPPAPAPRRDATSPAKDRGGGCNLGHGRRSGHPPAHDLDPFSSL